jgi:hypothetical protein
MVETRNVAVGAAHAAEAVRLLGEEHQFRVYTEVFKGGKNRRPLIFVAAQILLAVNDHVV